MKRVSNVIVLIPLCIHCIVIGSCCAYVPPEIRRRWKEEGYNLQQAIGTIENCAQRGISTDGLFGAVKYIDRFSSKLYSANDDKNLLMERAKGSWELLLALNSDKDQEFYPHPEFRAVAMAFIIVDDDYFGKGIASNGFCYVALGGSSSKNVKTRQVFMNYDDFYISGRAVPGWDLSFFTRGYERNWISTERQRPKLAFTIISATPSMLLVRGNKTGGMAIFRRIQNDMCPAAYGI